MIQNTPLAEILGTSSQNSICGAREFASPHPPCGLPLLATQRRSCRSLPSAGEAVRTRLGWLLADSLPVSLPGARLWNHLSLRGFIGHTARLCQREPERILTATAHHSPHSRNTSSMAPSTHAPPLRNGRPPRLRRSRMASDLRLSEVDFGKIENLRIAPCREKGAAASRHGGKSPPTLRPNPCPTYRHSIDSHR